MRYLGFVGFFAVFSVLAVIFHVYIWRRAIKATHAQPIVRRTVQRGVLILLCLIFLLLTFKEGVPLPLRYAVINAPYVWLAVMMLLVVLFALTDLGLLLAWLTFKILKKKWFSEHTMMWIQRVRVALVMVLVGIMTTIALWKGSQDPALTPVEIVLPKLPLEMDGFKIVQLTDIHINSNRTCDHLINTVALANSQQPDLIVITGDIIDKLPEEIGSCAAHLGKLKATHGVYYVTGNHEYYTGVMPWVFFFQEIGLRWLHNERVLIEKAPGIGFELMGIDDLTADKFGVRHGADLVKAARGHNRSLVSILLAHQPRIIEAAAREEISLVLSGHVHGGQIWPFGYLVLLQQPYLKGLYRYNDKTQIYINQGTGFWGPPARLGSFNELTLIKLKSGKE
jgi:predicted MPP superfamily phosphohydrolase